MLFKESQSIHAPSQTKPGHIFSCAKALGPYRNSEGNVVNAAQTLLAHTDADVSASAGYRLLCFFFFLKNCAPGNASSPYCA